MSKFFSSQTHENNLEFTPVDGYSRFHYAVLECRGITHLFDTLRYERAFLVRKMDVDQIVDLVHDELNAITAPLQVVIAAYGWDRKPQWRYDRLLSTMRLSELTISEVVALECDFTAFEAKPKLKLRSDINVIGPVRDILKVMYQNHAMPCREEDAHRIEQMPFCDDKSDCVRLTSFVPNEREWKF